MKTNKIKVDYLYRAPDMGQIVNRAIIKPAQGPEYKQGKHLHGRRYHVTIWPEYRRPDPAIDRTEQPVSLARAREMVANATCIPAQFTQNIEMRKI